MQKIILFCVAVSIFFYETKNVIQKRVFRTGHCIENLALLCTQSTIQLTCYLEKHRKKINLTDSPFAVLVAQGVAVSHSVALVVLWHAAGYAQTILSCRSIPNTHTHT